MALPSRLTGPLPDFSCEVDCSSQGEGLNVFSQSLTLCCPSHPQLSEVEQRLAQLEALVGGRDTTVVSWCGWGVVMKQVVLKVVLSHDTVCCHWRSGR